MNLEPDNWNDYAPEAWERAEAKRHALQYTFTGADLEAKEFPPLEWVIPDLIPEGYGLLIGPPKIGKSWFTYDLALNVARGGTILGGIPVKQRPVFLLAMEDGERRLKDRARMLLGPSVKIPKAITFQVKRTPDVLKSTIPFWLEDHGDKKPLIIIDTLQTVRPPMGRGNAYEFDYRMGEQMLDLIANYPGTGLLVIHHTNTGQTSDWMDSTSGTNGVNGSAEFTALLRSQRDSDEGILNVTGRDVIGGCYGVRFNSGQWLLEGASLAEAAEAARERAASSGLGDVNRQIVTALQAAGRPLIVSDVVGMVPGLDKKTAGTYLARLADSGRIRRVSRGTYATHPVATPPVESVESVEKGGGEPQLSTLSTLSTPPIETPSVERPGQ